MVKKPFKRFRRRLLPRQQRRTQAVYDLRAYNPFLNIGKPLYVPNTLGHYITVDWRERFDLTVENYDMILFIQSTHTASKAFVYYASGNGYQGKVVTEALALPYKGGEQPTQIRPMRQGCRVTSSGREDARAGVCTVLNTPDQMAWSDMWTRDGGSVGGGAWPKISDTDIQILTSQVLTHPHARTFSGRQLASGKSFCSAPQTIFGLTQWLDWKEVNVPTGTDTAVGLTEYNARKSAWDTALQKRALNSLIMHFPASPGNAQTYTIELMGQDAAVFPHNSLVQTMARAPPTGNPADFEMGALQAAGSAMATGGTIGTSQGSTVPGRPEHSRSPHRYPKTPGAY